MALPTKAKRVIPNQENSDTSSDSDAPIASLKFVAPRKQPRNRPKKKRKEKDHGLIRLKVANNQEIELFIDEKKWTEEAGKTMEKLKVDDIFLVDDDGDRSDQDWIPSDEEGPKRKYKKMQREDICMPLRDKSKQKMDFLQDKDDYWTQPDLTLPEIRELIWRNMGKAIENAKKKKADAKVVLEQEQELLEVHYPRESRRADVPYVIPGKKYNELMDAALEYERAYKEVEHLRFEFRRRCFLFPRDSITALRYNAADKIYEAKCVGRKGTMRTARLPEVFVQDIFHDEFLQVVMEASKGGGDDFQNAKGRNAIDEAAYVVPLEDGFSHLEGSGPEAFRDGAEKFYYKQKKSDIISVVVGFLVNGKLDLTSHKINTDTRNQVLRRPFLQTKYRMFSTVVEDKNLDPNNLMNLVREKQAIVIKELENKSMRSKDWTVPCEEVSGTWLDKMFPLKDGSNTFSNFLRMRIRYLVVDKMIKVYRDDHTFQRHFFGMEETFNAAHGWPTENNKHMIESFLVYSNRRQFTGITWSENWGYWCGLYCNKHGGNVVEHDVPQEWMDANFSKEFQDDVYNRSKGNKRRIFVTVPVGACLKPVKNIPDTPSPEIMMPRVKYQQGVQDLCFSASLASAFHIHGRKELGKAIHEYGISLLHTADAWQNRLLLVQKFVMSDPYVRKCWQPVRLTRDDDIMDIDTMGQPALIVPQGSDSSINHAFTVFNNMIYDSNNPEAMLLTVNNIEAILSSGGPLVHYKGISSGYLFRWCSITKRRRRRGKRGH